MRLKLKVKAEVKEYSKRKIKRFAYLPKVLKDNYFVWWEEYYVEQTYIIWRRRGRWEDTKTWSVKTEQRNMLDVIKGDDDE